MKIVLSTSDHAEQWLASATLKKDDGYSVTVRALTQIVDARSADEAKGKLLTYIMEKFPNESIHGITVSGLAISQD